MAITDQDIRLMASEVLSDTSDAGGRMSGVEVIDGVSNNLFADISELDRTIGRVSLRKAFAAVLSENRDSYYGVNVIVDEIPADPRVSVTLFTTQSWTDERAAAVSRMESYLARGPKYDGYLWDQHIAGQRVLLVLQRPERELPAVGSTLVVVKNPGLVSEQQQFVRATGVTSDVRTFEIEGYNGPFQRAVVTIEISDPLQFDVMGGQPSPYSTDTSSSKLYTTVVADAAKYAGMTALAEAAALGDFTVQVASIWGQLVPSAQVEAAITDARPHGAGQLPAATGSTVTLTTTAVLSPSSALYVGQGVYPGSLSLTIGSTVITDKAGVLEVDGAQVGLIDYDNGILTIASGGPDYGAASKSIAFRVGASAPRSMQTIGWDVTPESRSGTVVFILDPAPAPGSLSISYMAQGKWYVLRDDGAGRLRGSESAYGSGVVSYVSGSVVVTLGALPDVGSTVIAVYGQTLLETDRAGGAVSASQQLQLTLSEGEGLTPGQISISWLGHDATPKTATDDGAGALTGDATGSIDYAAGRVTFTPAVLPAIGTTITVDADAGEQRGISTAITSIVANVIELAEPPMPGTLRMTIPVTYSSQPGAAALLIRDEGSNLVAYGGTGYISSRFDPVTVGTINLATGVCTLDDIAALSGYTVRYVKSGFNRSSMVARTGDGQLVPANSEYTYIGYYSGANLTTLTHAEATATYVIDGDATPLPAQQFAWAPALQLYPASSDGVVPGSVRLQFAGKTYIDRAGVLVTDVAPATGAGVNAGTINYSSGAAALSIATAGSSNSGTVLALLTQAGADIGISECTFRTASAPLRPGSLIVQFQYADAPGTVTVTSATNGLLTAADLDGRADFQTGITRLRFGRWVAVTPEVEAEPWYDPSAVVEGEAFRPRPVIADSIRYAAVAYSYIPLDAGILGVDPVRLPTDGRVPIFRVGDVAVVHNTQHIAVASPSNGQVINCGRVRLSRAIVFDAAGVRVATSRYTEDLDAGTVTLTDVSGLAAPLSVEHRVEDMALISDVQINGQLTFTRPLTHDYSAGTTGVSSALVIGDLQARATRPFDQQTWTGAWSDSLIGNSTTAEYNDTVYPVEVDNEGAAQERWALIFTSPTQVRVVGESVGDIAISPIANEIAPINPATGAPYFRLSPLGWGAGWSTGNVLRFNTIAANYPIWLARTVQQGPASGDADHFRIQIRGDADAE